jgi:hypothetical protein
MSSVAATKTNLPKGGYIEVVNIHGKPHREGRNPASAAPRILKVEHYSVASSEAAAMSLAIQIPLFSMVKLDHGKRAKTARGLKQPLTRPSFMRLG